MNTFFLVAFGVASVVTFTMATIRVHNLRSHRSKNLARDLKHAKEAAARLAQEAEEQQHDKPPEAYRVGHQGNHEHRHAHAS